MRYYAFVLIALLALTNVAFCAVGDSGVSDGSTNAQFGPGYDTGTVGSVASQVTGYLVSASQSPGFSPQTGDSSGSQLAYQAFSQGSEQDSGYQPSEQSAANYQSNSYGSNYAANPPQIAGPYQEHLSADDLNFAAPNAESFHPDASLSFAPASPPSGINIQAYNPGQGNWYYPESAASKNRFYVQTSVGLTTTAGCSYGGYLPLWSDINSPGNFYVYEWYPGQLTPSVRWWGWAWQGFKKGWFTGDVPGWHILIYNCGDWSNYVYIYVWPSGRSAYVSNPSGYSNINGASLPSGAPAPPNLAGENLMLPDYNQYQPDAGCSGQSYAQGPNVAMTNAFYPAGSAYPIQGAYSTPNPAQSGYSTSTCPTCSDTAGSAVGAYVPASGPQYTGTNYQAVYPKPTSYKVNEYYVQTCSSKLGTVAGAKYGEWLPLWSKIGKPGIYWSFEWTQCAYPQVFCYPDVKSFGYKGMGWYQTWFRGDSPGWHVLSYYNGDWSNYIYVYVWSV